MKHPRRLIRSMIGDPVHHRPGRPVPLGHDQHVTRPEMVDGLLELGPVLHAATADLLAEDEIASVSPQRGNLSVKILLWARNPSIADFPHHIPPPILSKLTIQRK
jgi:hypothetical protein